MDEGSATELVAGSILETGLWHSMDESEGSLNLDDSFTWSELEVNTPHAEGMYLHTQKRQSIIKPSPPLIKTLVRNSKPFELVGQHLVAVFAQHGEVELVKPRRVLVDVEIGPSGIHM